MDALAIVDSLLGDDPKGIAQESYDDFHASAKVKSANPEVRLMPSRRFEYGQDVLLMSDGGPLYAGTIVPRGKLWKIAAVAKNLGRRTLGSMDFYTENPEEAAQGLLDALKPWWENKLRWQSAHVDVMGESQRDYVVFDDLPSEVKMDIAGYLFENIPALSEHWSWEYVLQELDGLVEPPVLERRTVPVRQLANPKAVASVAVQKYAKLSGHTAPPILVDRNEVLEGGHRFAAAQARGDATINVIDIGPLVHLDWDRFLAGDTAGFPTQGSVRESLCDEIDAAAEDAARPNSAEQAEAGNYQKGHCSLHGLQIAIENAKGSTRSGTSDDGSTWSVTMPAHYGYIKGTQGKDKDHIDVYIGPKPGGFLIFVVNQNTKGGKFDEHKCMFGFESKDDAIKAYDAAFNDGLGPKLRASVVSTTVDNFKAWLEDGNHKKPFENVSESLVTEMLDSDLKDFAGDVPMRQTFGDLQPGDVIQTEGGDGPIYQIVGTFYDQTGRYRRSFLGLDHKHNQAMNPGTAVEYVEYCPSLAYGEFDRRAAAAAEEPFNSPVKYLGTTVEWTPEKIWAHMKETGERNRRGNAQDYNRNNPDDPNNPYGPHDGPPPPPRHRPEPRAPRPPLRRE